MQLFKKRYWGGYHIPRHFNIFSALGLERIASSFDLNLISVRYKPQPVHWIWSIHHIMKDLNFPKKLIGFFNMKNVFLLIVFTALEILQGLFTKRKSNMELVFKKKSY